MKFVLFRFQRTEKMDSVMKGQMGAMPASRIFGLEPPLDTAEILPVDRGLLELNVTAVS